jgi:N-acetyl-anhydromuramyl-L-alanine amidase AmpD
MPSTTDWNDLVPEGNRYDSPNHNSLRPAVKAPSHIAIHVTGNDSVAVTKRLFLKEKSVSAHYLISKDGQLFQFVKDSERAFHAGIDRPSLAIYRGAASWRKYLKYFAWYKKYPKDSIYLDADLKPVWDKTEAAFVARADNAEWPNYELFNSRWGMTSLPVNFETDPDPNNYSIGIEIVSFGATTPDSNAYTADMYRTLVLLTGDLSRKYEIPLEKGRVVGHEDLNPVGRFGWDPGAGFNWAKIYEQN